MSEETKIKTRRLSVSEQEQSPDRLYDMCIRFVGDAEPMEINQLLSSISGGAGGKLSARDAVTLRLRQTVPFIPDDEVLKKYAKVLEEAQTQKSSGVLVSNVRFDSYEWLYMVRPETESEEKPDENPIPLGRSAE